MYFAQRNPVAPGAILQHPVAEGSSTGPAHAIINGTAVFPNGIDSPLSIHKYPWVTRRIARLVVAQVLCLAPALPTIGRGPVINV
jgi:hypothetical protein